MRMNGDSNKHHQQNGSSSGNHRHQTTSSTTSSPLHQRILDFENRLKKFNLLSSSNTSRPSPPPPVPLNQHPPPIPVPSSSSTSSSITVTGGGRTSSTASNNPHHLPSSTATTTIANGSAGGNHHHHHGLLPRPIKKLPIHPAVPNSLFTTSNNFNNNLNFNNNNNGHVPTVSNGGCMTSPLPRKPLGIDLNGSRDGGKYKKRTSHEWSGGGLGTASALSNRHSDSAEVEKRLREIMKQTGILKIHGKEYRNTTPSDLEDLGELGHGTCGHVFKMKFKQTGDIMAVKQLRLTGNKEENKRVIMDLDVVLRSFDCPYIVKCLGCFITDSDVWICMELMATCLEKLSKRLRGPIPEDILGKMAVSILKALNFLKEGQGIIHRDVKPSNMLLDWNGTIKLCDFGISGRLVDSKAKTRTAGCAAYMAPERIEPPDPHKPDYDIRADVWSLGISLVELARGRFPYEGCSTDFEVLTRILEDDPPLITPSEGYSTNFCSFVQGCLTKDYKKRPKFSKLLEHKFILEYESKDVDVGKWFQNVMENSPDSNQNTVTVTRFDSKK